MHPGHDMLDVPMLGNIVLPLSLLHARDRMGDDDGSKRTLRHDELDRDERRRRTRRRRIRLVSVLVGSE